MALYTGECHYCLSITESQVWVTVAENNSGHTRLTCYRSESRVVIDHHIHVLFSVKCCVIVATFVRQLGLCCLLIGINYYHHVIALRSTCKAHPVLLCPPLQGLHNHTMSTQPPKSGYLNRERKYRPVCIVLFLQQIGTNQHLPCRRFFSFTRRDVP